MQSENRNSQGRFVSGHKGAKPKGAINKSTRDYLARLDKVNALLESNLEENISSLSKKEQVMFWLEMQKFIHGKLSKFSEPEPPKEQISKITFQVIGPDGTTRSDHENPPVSPAPGVSAPPQPAPVPPAANAPILYGNADMGRVRNPNHFSRFRSI